MTLLSALFPRGMRRRWWMFRPIDALVALCPAPRERRGAVVVRMDGIGDMVMFRAALEHYPAALDLPKSEITILGCHSWKAVIPELFDGFRVVTIDEHAFEKKWLYRLKIALWIRRQGFRTALCDMFMRKTLTADTLVWASRAERRIVCAPFVTERTRAEYGWYLGKATRVIDTGPYPTHEGLRHFAFLQALTGRPVPPETVRIPWPEREPPAEMPTGAPYIVMFIGSNEPGRRWPLEHFMAVTKRAVAAGFRVVFVGGPQEAPAKPALAALGLPGLIDLVGVLKLNRTVDVMKRAACVVANDSGPGHLAVGVGAPVVMMAGGGHFGCFVPYPEAVRPARARFLSHEMECYHCLWRCHRRARPDQTFPCVAEITPDAVWASVLELTSR